MSLNLTSLPAYVDSQRVPLIAKSVFGSKTAKLISNQLGVKGESNALCIFIIGVYLQLY